MRLIPSLFVAAALLFAGEARATPLEEKEKESEKSPPPAGGLSATVVGELPPIVPPRKVLPRVELHGGAYFWYYQPLSVTVDSSPSDSNIELYLASLDFEGRLDDFGLVLNPRFRDSKVRDFFTSNVWIEQAYAFYKHDALTVKLGKVYHQFSRLWDNSFYGNIPYFDGFKLDANYGLSLEGYTETSTGFGIGYYGQYFLIDGGTNGSLRDRDTVWVEDVHRRHTAVLRFEPSFRFDRQVSVRMGLSGEHTYVDFTPKTGIEPQSVFRFAADLSFVYGPVRVFGEYIGQFGKTITDYPFPRKPATTTPAEPGRSSKQNHYVVTGGEVQFWRLTGRYSFSMVKYNELGVTELLHLPGAAVALHDNVSLIVEYAYWRRMDPGSSATLDNSLNVTVHARF